MAQKFTTEGRKGLSNVGVSKKSEPLGAPRDQSSGAGGQHTDPSVRLGALTGPASTGEVPMATTMRKPQAYRGGSK